MVDGTATLMVTAATPKSGCGCQPIETKRGVALLDQPGAFQTLQTLRHVDLVAMLDDHHPQRRNHMRSIKIVENVRKAGFVFIWWVEKYEIREEMARSDAFEAAKRRRFHHFGAIVPGAIQVLFSAAILGCLVWLRPRVDPGDRRWWALVVLAMVLMNPRIMIGRLLGEVGAVGVTVEVSTGAVLGGLARYAFALMRISTISMGSKRP